MNDLQRAMTIRQIEAELAKLASLCEGFKRRLDQVEDAGSKKAA